MARILIADDNLQITQVLTEYIKKEGWQCFTAHDGEEALQLFSRYEKEIIMVFLTILTLLFLAMSFVSNRKS